MSCWMYGIRVSRGKLILLRTNAFKTNEITKMNTVMMTRDT